MKIPPLNVKIKRCILNGQMYDLLSYEKYAESNDLVSSSTAVEMTYKDTDIILPYKGKITNNKPNIPGIYNAGCIDFIVYPDDNFITDYIPQKIISMDNHTAMKEILKKEEMLSKMDEPWITSPDNITRFPIVEGDQPEMICLKSALNEKKIDFDKYAPRFGVNFPNGKRQMKNKSATLNIIKRFCEKCDMEAILTLRDKNNDVPNPIGREITVSLTEDYYNEDED